MRKTFLFLILFPGLLFAADGYNHRAQLDSIEKKGFYKILLTPEIISVLQSDYRDIRLYDSKNNEIPYLFSEERPVTVKSYFKEMEILENTPIFKPKVSRIVIHNIGKKVLSELFIIVRNTDANREVTLKGSDDNGTWYFISSSYPTRLSEKENETSEIRSISFPRSNYEYFELTIRNNKYEPLQILKMGYRNSELDRGLYTTLPLPKIIQKDTLKRSFITVIYDREYEFSKLEWKITGPEMFHRQCKLGEFSKFSKHDLYGIFQQYELTSKRSSVWEFPKLKTDSLILIIENEDNTPLKVLELQAYQINKYLIAQLQPDEKYTLFFGNVKDIAPEYDLKYFADVIPAQLPVIKPLKLEVIPAGQVKPLVKTKPVFFNKTILWIVIIVIAVGLGVLSIKMVREMGKKS
jgi:hypothetical protein